jgi:hypothetical protein
MLCYSGWTPLNKKVGKVMGKYSIGYDGFIIVDANDEEEAYDKANKYLSKTGLVNDGDEGEWYLTEAEEVD